MSAEDPELRGWKAIALAVGRCERVCRLKALRSFDPLPVWDDGDETPCAWLSAIQEWKRRQRRPWSHKGTPSNATVCQSTDDTTTLGK